MPCSPSLFSSPLIYDNTLPLQTSKHDPVFGNAFLMNTRNSLHACSILPSIVTNVSLHVRLSTSLMHTLQNQPKVIKQTFNSFEITKSKVGIVSIVNIEYKFSRKQPHISFKLPNRMKQSQVTSTESFTSFNIPSYLLRRHFSPCIPLVFKLKSHILYSFQRFSHIPSCCIFQAVELFMIHKALHTGSFTYSPRLANRNISSIKHVKKELQNWKQLQDEANGCFHLQIFISVPIKPIPN